MIGGFYSFLICFRQRCKLFFHGFRFFSFLLPAGKDAGYTVPFVLEDQPQISSSIGKT